MLNISKTILSIGVLLLPTYGFSQQDFTKSPLNPVFNVLGTTSWNTDIEGAGNDGFGHGIIDNNTYKLYIGGKNADGFHIGMVSTTDLNLETGWTWSPSPVLSGGGTGAWDELGVGNAMVIKDGNDYEMWFTGISATGERNIGYATSTDGENWTKYSGNPVFTSADIPSNWTNTPSIPAVIKDNTGYKMWYLGFSGPSYSHHEIGYATSPDGITWTDHTSNPVVSYDVNSTWYSDHVDLPVVRYEDGEYHMWLTGGITPTLPGAQPQIGYISSPDGISWDMSTLVTPVIELGTPGMWDSGAIGSADVQKIGDQYKLIYGGSDLQTTFGVGIASTPSSVGIDDVEHQDDKFHVYTNSHKQVVLEAVQGSYNDILIQVYDIQGREIELVHNHKLPEHSYTTLNSQLKPGIYLVSVTHSNKETVTYKIVSE